jgi:gas vesicle protein
LKPYKGEAYRDAAYNLVRRVAKNDNSSPLDQDIVNFIENGTERFAKGIGAFSARARQIGANIKLLKNEMVNQGMTHTRRLFDIAEETTNKLSKVGESSTKAIDVIQEEVRKKQAMILQEAARLEMQYQKRLSQLKGRSSEIEKIGIGRTNLSRITNSLVKIVGGTVGSYIAIRGVSEVGRRLTE